jgi:hypothetical protein
MKLILRPIKNLIMKYISSVIVKSFTLTVLFLAVIPQTSKAQLYQILRGTVVDKESQSPLIGATVKVQSEDFLDSFRDTKTDERGQFELSRVWVGRNTLKITLPDYSDYLANGLILSSGKEGVFQIALEKEFIERMGSVDLKAKKNNDQTNNDAALISARLFTVEETDRFAGSRGDPARMASNFAGVQGADDSRNDIVVRGNSPAGILWRVEGIDIPNPNHFAIPGTTGGSVSIINNKILGNSDFFTGAFPAEYGNGISGAFDLKLRQGNAKKHEMSSQFGILGWDLLAEGPLNNKGATYLVTYRYSTLSMLGALNVPIGTDAIPRYQDASFHLKFPLKNKASFSVFGMGGLSNIDIMISDKTQSSRNLYGDNDRDQFFGSSMGVLGASYQKSLSANAYVKAVVSFNHQRVDARHQLAFFTVLDTFYKDGEQYNNLQLDSIVPNLDYRFQEQSLGMHLFLNKSFNTRSTVKFGIQYRHYWYTYFDSARNLNQNLPNYWNWSLRWNSNNSPADLLIPYVQWKNRWTRKLTTVIGIQSQLFGIGYNPKIEQGVPDLQNLRGFAAAWALPRLGLTYQLAPKHRLNFGAGIHAQTQSPYLYYFNLPGNNKPHLLDMELTKSAHYIAGWDWNTGKASRVKVEAYYQNLWDIPVEMRASSFSLANTGSGFSRFFPDSLQSTGIAYNYGVELTVERFFSKGFYYLFSGSLFKAMYRGSDEIWRNSDFNTDYAVNALIAKEFSFSNKHIWNIGGKATFAGARRFSPIDSAASVNFREYRELDALKNTERFGKPYVRFDLRLSYRYNAKKVSHEFAIDLINITNQKNILNYTYINEPPYRRINYQLGLLPLFYYKIDFSL